MRVTVCELADDPARLETDWAGLVEHVRAAHSELVLLPEMPFYRWFARERESHPEVWQAAVAAHEAWLARLAELQPAAVLGSRPVTVEQRRENQGFVWDHSHGLRPAHVKYYLPDEAGFWEASWYGRGSGRFAPVWVGPACVGFMICTDLWFLEHARAYGRSGAHLIVNPRATEWATVDKWLVGGRAASIVSGAYCLSSNRAGDQPAEAPMGGQGWVVGPDGEVLALTSSQQPFVTIDVDLEQAERAKQTYPRYVLE